MTGKLPPTVRVINDYQAPFPDPIRVNAGEEVSVDLNKTTNIPGWLWCTSRAGKSGWVPAAYVEQRETKGLMKYDYDAIELTIRVGDILTVNKVESDFYWVTDRNGRHGWVPVAHVEPYRRGRNLEAK